MLSRGRKIQLVPCFNSVEFVMCLWIACAVLTLVASHQSFYTHRYGKRFEPRIVADNSFITGSRYGRSDPSQKCKKVPTFQEVQPPVDMSTQLNRYEERIPQDFRTASFENRLSAILDFMYRANGADLERDDDKGNDLDFLS
ncbi:uncharacterized protein LOC143183636 [Calliopsis andreniformis]|uniref:uncharacterized protein LOC143183636 n=1 Tax=Calliopsis andreniformis TaxID=337506 RepID=UPI003FCC7571